MVIQKTEMDGHPALAMTETGTPLLYRVFIAPWLCYARHYFITATKQASVSSTPILSTPTVALGLMSGTSADGVDVGLVTATPAGLPVTLGPWGAFPYPQPLRQAITHARNHYWGKKPADTPALADLENAITLFQCQSVEKFLRSHRENHGFTPPTVIGFHGQTLWHKPPQRKPTPAIGTTCQLANGPLMARRLGIPVVTNFRDQDMRQGGHGAPLVPVFHWALLHNHLHNHPLWRDLTLRSNATPPYIAWLNIGGVSNITWVKEDIASVTARDVGPGNALIDDWVQACTASPHPDTSSSHAQGLQYDPDGALGLAGKVHDDLLEEWSRMWLEGPHSHGKGQAHDPNSMGPNSMDRDAYQRCVSDCFSANLTLEDGAATLAAFTVACVVHALTQEASQTPQLPDQPPAAVIVSGGGVNNRAIMKGLSLHMPTIFGNILPPLLKASDLGWPDQAIEAYAFAYLALRSVQGLPLSFPGTTGVKMPSCGGICHHPSPC